MLRKSQKKTPLQYLLKKKNPYVSGPIQFCVVQGSPLLQSLTLILSQSLTTVACYPQNLAKTFHNTALNIYQGKKVNSPP